MRSPAESVALVVPVRDEAPTLDAFLESVSLQTRPPDEIAICDGGSVDGSRDVLRRWAASVPGIRLVEDRDAYPGRARNLAIDACSAEWIALTDAGTVLPSDWLARLVAARDRCPRAEVVYGSYEPILTGLFERCAALAFLAPARQVPDGFLRGPSTASMLIRKTAWRAAGGFPERLRAAEDLVFFDRIRACGFTATEAPDAIVGWRMPASARQVFRRFRAFSRHTLRARLGDRWHRPVARMYAIGLVLTTITASIDWRWAIVLMSLAFGSRAAKTIWSRRPPFGPKVPIGPITFAGVAALLALIDAAMVAGALDFLRHDRRNRARFVARDGVRVERATTADR